MSENAIDSVKGAPEPAAAKPKGKPGKKLKPAKKAGRAKKATAKPKTDRANKKADVIAMMKRAKGATLAGLRLDFVALLKKGPEPPIRP